MIEATTIVSELVARGFRRFSGVPCSYLTPLIDTVITSDALDYIDAAGSTSQTDIAAELPDALDPLVEDVMTLVAGGKFEAAFDLLGGDDDLPLEQAALKDLLRARLTERYRGALDLSSVPIISAAPDRIQGTDLPPDAGFLLSLLDGHTQLADVVSLSGMDPFAAFRLVRGLVAAQLVELRA